MMGLLKAEVLKFENQIRFILEKCENKIPIENCQRAEMIKVLQDCGYNSDPVNSWRESQENCEMEDEGSCTVNEFSSKVDRDFDYLLGMSLWNFSLEKKDELLQKKDKKINELRDLNLKTPSEIWKNDLNLFLGELDKVEKQEESVGSKYINKNTTGKEDASEPSPFKEIIDPRIDEYFDTSDVTDEESSPN